MVATVLADALGPRQHSRLLQHGKPFCVCVQVPDDAWMQPVRDAAVRLARVPEFYWRDSTARRTANDEPIDSLIQTLTRGCALLCVSQDVAALPRALRTIADAHVTLRPPNPRQIATILGVILGGRSPRSAPADLGTGLDLQELAGCVRDGEARHRAVARIKRAQAAKRSATVDRTGPRLEDLHGYGAAADWGMRVRDEVAEYRAARLPWHDIQSSLVLHGPPGTGKTLSPRRWPVRSTLPSLRPP